MDYDTDVPPPPPWTGPPHDQLPGATAAGIILGRGPHTVVALNPLRCFPSGVELTLSVRTASPVLGLYARVMGRDPAFGTRVDGALHWAFALADGTTLSADYLSDGELGPTLTARTSEGTDGAVDATYWLAPLPLVGPVTLVCSWREHGIVETTTSLDVNEIRDAAARSLSLLNATI
ncbi:hypothetical protein [Georgenia yuyongxinii]|uniref:Uncharacterized protein n=1 Tax=Georgenia yuyongxinii TaxID=2589797 RepID=A0A552WVG3_9MICO|nr:hypothetical protein [Georgenia yuyongxinii]TRW46716.1 hypothetical protein FJ693_04290 [Georgenia yuyongxinii]